MTNGVSKLLAALSILGGSIAGSAAAQEATADFRMYASDGFVGKIGGAGEIYGSAGFQDVSILPSAGAITLDTSFGSGGDIIRLSGNASEFTIWQSGSRAMLKRGTTYLSAPLDDAGIVLMFNDGARKLGLGAGGKGARIGGQSFTSLEVQVTAGPDGTVLPAGADDDASAQLAIGPGSDLIVVGNFAVFGTSGAEKVRIDGGRVTLDPSFNQGSDTVVLSQPAPSFEISRDGENVELSGEGGAVSIPIGRAGTKLQFPAGDTRRLSYDGNVKVGDQSIDAASLEAGQKLGAR